MTALRREDVLNILGPLEDSVIAELIEMGVTASELAEARAWLNNDEPLLNSGRPLPTGRVARIIEIIDEIEAEIDPLLKE